MWVGVVEIRVRNDGKRRKDIEREKECEMEKLEI